MALRYAVRGLAGLLLTLACAAPAAAQGGGQIYWANQSGNSIGRANIDGTGADPAFIPGAVSPRAVAVAGARLYWAHGNVPGRIGIARRNLSSVNQSLVTTGSTPTGVAVDTVGLYWTYSGTAGGRVGRARQDGVGPNPNFGTTASPAPCGVAVDFDQLYWGNPSTNAVGRSHGPFSINQAFIPGASSPCGVAVTATHVYWANRGGNSIGRADRDGSNANQSFLSANSPCGVTADANYVYWSNGNGTIGRARLDGSGAEQSFISGAGGPCGVAVDPTVTPGPASYRFRAARVRGAGQIKDFFLQNTSSSALGVFRITVLGPHAGDFVKTGESCVQSLTTAGAGCPINVSFRPRRSGTRRAVLRIESSASNSPTDIPLSGRGDGKAPRVRRASVKGSTLRYSLSERARLRMSLARRASGKRRFRRLRGYSDRGRAGRNRKRLSRRKLRPGAYRLTVRARDAVGNSSRRVVRFRVAR